MKGQIPKGTNAPENAVRIITGRLGGKWLEKLGFAPGDVLTVAAAPGVITYHYQKNGLERARELVKFARANRMRLIQVQKKGPAAFIEIPESCLKRAGIAPDETLIALYQPGQLQLQRPDLS